MNVLLLYSQIHKNIFLSTFLSFIPDFFTYLKNDDTLMWKIIEESIYTSVDNDDSDDVFYWALTFQHLYGLKMNREAAMKLILLGAVHDVLLHKDMFPDLTVKDIFREQAKIGMHIVMHQWRLLPKEDWDEVIRCMREQNENKTNVFIQNKYVSTY